MLELDLRNTPLENAVIEILESIGENPDREGLQETPARVARAWRDWTRGYKQDPKEIFKAFEDGGESYDEMILVKDIPFYSHCEHHLAPFFGVVHVAYIPHKRIIGLSKIPRLVDIFAHRLQVQERMTAQIAETLWTGIGSKGVAVSVRARHLCMESRGIQKQNTWTVTTSLTGLFRDDPTVRNEFLSSVRGDK